MVLRSMMKGVIVIIMMMSFSIMSLMSLTVYAFSSSSSLPFPYQHQTTSHKNRDNSSITIVSNDTISAIRGECVPGERYPGFGELGCGQYYPPAPFHIRTLIANQTSLLASQGYTEVKFRVSANITNVYLSVAAEEITLPEPQA